MLERSWGSILDPTPMMKEFASQVVGERGLRQLAYSQWRNENIKVSTRKAFDYAVPMKVWEVQHILRPPPARLPEHGFAMAQVQ
jgi:hypothetical protein